MSKTKKDVRFSHSNGRRSSRAAADNMDGAIDEKRPDSPAKNGHATKSERPAINRSHSTDAGWTDDDKVRHPYGCANNH